MPKLENKKVFENYSKCRIWIFHFWHFPPIFDKLKVTCLVTLFDRKLQLFKTSPKLTIFCIFNELLATQNVNVARFARNVECDFFSEFQTLWCCTIWFQSHDRTSQRCTRGLNDRLDLKTWIFLDSLHASQLYVARSTFWTRIIEKNNGTEWLHTKDFYFSESDIEQHE